MKIGVCIMDFSLLPRFDAVSREEAEHLLFSCEYGVPPAQPDAVQFTEITADETFCAGKAILRRITAEIRQNGRTFSFPFHFVCPKHSDPVPAVVFINFTPAVPDAYLPSEELCDLGIAVASFGYTDVSPDNDDFASMAGGLLAIDRSVSDAPGKIAVWAWAARIVMDYVQTRPEIDLRNVAVAGHSRLGKTALLAAALDERFQFAYANESGCAGAALFRGKTGETAADIHRVFPFWFCPNFANYTNAEDALPFDQHFLLALIAPRSVYVSSAAEDLWADPKAEYAACAAASPAFERMGRTGLIADGTEAVPGTVLHEGGIGYHIRNGSHYMSREDWQKFIAYLKKHRN
ncbi:MAG: alpha/beta hydrolase [Hominenteromicrobium sp.]